MRVDCIKAVAKALGRPLKAGESEDIENMLKKAMRGLRDADPQAFLGKSVSDRLNEAAELAAQEILADAQLKKQRVALQAAAVQRVSNVIADGRAAGLNGFQALDHQVAFHADSKTNALSVETQAKAIYKDSVRQMLDTLTASNPKWFGLLENKEGVEAVIRSLFGEDSGSQEAKRGGELFHEVAEAMRQRMNRAGGDIGKLDNWNIPQHHSQLRVAKAGVDAWVSKMLDWVDRKAYVDDAGEQMSTEKITDFLREAWNTISSGGLNKLEPGKFKGNGARANRGSQERQIHFKDADSYMAYQKEFGERSMYEVLIGHIQNLAKDIALVETFGPNPDATFRLFRDQALRDEGMANRTNLGKAKKAAVRSESLYNVVSGKTLPVASEWLARSFDTLRSWLVASRLGSAVISSFSDDATLHLTAHILDLPEMQLIKNELAAFNPANKVEERMANRAGLALDTMVATLNRFGQDELGTSFASKLGSTVLRASGLFAMTEARRRAFGVTAMHAMGSVIKEHGSLEALDAADKRLLKNRGITEADFKVWKAAEQEDWGNGNDSMLTPDSIYRIPDEVIDKIIPIEKMTEAKDAAVADLKSRDAEDRGWVEKRAQGISSWLAKERQKVEARIGKSDAAAKAKLEDVHAKIGRLEENVEALAESWHTPQTRGRAAGDRAMLDEFGEDTPIDQPADVPGVENKRTVGFYGKGKLREKGVDEGRAREAAKNLKSHIGEISRDLKAAKIDVLDQLFDRFNERRAELEEFTKQSDERIGKRQKVVDRLERDLNPAIERARDDARQKAATRLLGIILEETDVAVVEPGAVERAIAGAGLQRGTLKGELTKSFFLFKSFPMAMIHRHFMRGMSMPNRGGRAAYIATLIAATTVAGALSLEVSEILKGRDPRKLFGGGSFRNWIAAMLKGGSLGIYGDFLFSEQSQHGGSLLAGLAGPVAGEAEDIFKLTQGNAVQAMQGKDTDIGAETVKFVKGNLPGANLWYAKAALDHMVFDRMQEYFAPGYLRKSRNRAQTEFGQEFWWEPGEVTPQRAPDLGAVAGE